MGVDNLGDEYIKDLKCKHKWIKRKCVNPMTNKLVATWEVCYKCGSERKREVYNNINKLLN